MSIFAWLLGTDKVLGTLEQAAMKLALPKKLKCIERKRGTCTNPRLVRLDVLFTDEALHKLEATGALEVLAQMKEDGEFLRGGTP
jgi:hypothetical protein